MTPKEHHLAIVAELDSLGLNDGHANPKEVWAALCTYVERAAFEDDEIVGFEFAHYTFTGEEKLHLQMVIQFELYDGDEYSHMEQIQCRFRAPPNQLMAGRRSNINSDDYSDLASYFFAVESDGNFAIMNEIDGWQFDCIHTGV